ncbi:MAG: 2OG-Fe(II) oxygenase [Candidatus Sericytochromatia bacterium]
MNNASPDSAFEAAHPINDNVMRAFYYADIFKAEECERILRLPTDPELTENFEVLQRAGMQGYAQYMQAPYALLTLQAATPWLYPYIHTLFHALNDKHYHFKLGQVMGIQRLHLQPGHTVDWHFDLGEGMFSRRKLSLVVWLNAPEAYQGGNLEIMTNGETGVKRTQGTIGVFPSFMASRISPVTAGEQQLLLAWMHSETGFR